MKADHSLSHHDVVCLRVACWQGPYFGALLLLVVVWVPAMHGFGWALSKIPSRSGLAPPAIYMLSWLLPLVVGPIFDAYFPRLGLYVRQALLLVPHYCLGFGVRVIASYAMCVKASACAEVSPLVVRGQLAI